MLLRWHVEVFTRFVCLFDNTSCDELESSSVELKLFYFLFTKKWGNNQNHHVEILVVNFDQQQNSEAHFFLFNNEETLVINVVYIMLSWSQINIKPETKILRQKLLSIMTNVPILAILKGLSAKIHLRDRTTNLLNYTPLI